MEYPDRDYWLWASKISFTLGLALVGVNGALDAARPHFMFWTSPVMIPAYIAFTVALLCFVCAIREVPFPFAVSRSWPRPPGGPRGYLPNMSLPVRSNDGADIREDARTGVTRAPHNGRKFTDKSPRELCALVRPYTSAQAKILLELYRNQWLSVEGALDDVGEWTGSYSEVTLRRNLLGPAIVMRFTDKSISSSPLSMLRPGSHITVTGQIADINASSITITNCELVSIRR